MRLLGFLKTSQNEGEIMLQILKACFLKSWQVLNIFLLVLTMATADDR